MSSSVALGDQTAAVALVTNPLTFWAKAKAEPVSSLGRRAGVESKQRSDVYLYVQYKLVPVGIKKASITWRMDAEDDDSPTISL